MLSTHAKWEHLSHWRLPTLLSALGTCVTSSLSDPGTPNKSPQLIFPFLSCCAKAGLGSRQAAQVLLHQAERKRLFYGVGFSQGITCGPSCHLLHNWHKRAHSTCRSWGHGALLWQPRADQSHSDSPVDDFMDFCLAIIFGVVWAGMGWTDPLLVWQNVIWWNVSK